jgi:putative sigma-54 modulation protein
MQLNLTGKNFKITPAIKTYVDEKFASLEQRYSQITTVHVVLNIEHTNNVAEATVHFHGKEIHAKANGDDMYMVIDSLVEKLAGQIHKLKEKNIDSHRQPT